tara:strand:- start:197 stop:364 length:168 start_codon:yes stop_codon:yes gene_type:complete
MILSQGQIHPKGLLIDLDAVLPGMTEELASHHTGGCGWVRLHRNGISVHKNATVG